ncbi:MAG: M28 family metallopeptidase [Acidobacteriota bacterium]
MRCKTAGLFLLALTILSAALGISTIRPPAVVPADAPAEDFSADRARRHLEAIATDPHPLGSQEHARVRQYLVRELEALGLVPEIQATTEVLRTSPISARAAYLNNVMTRVPGTGSGKALLLLSHYDTVPQSPGAGDDSAGVAAMLEVLRALRTGPALPRDIIALFSDGEELGLIGASAFLDQHPWAADVGMVVNLEARGTRGPSLMFETSRGNQRLIREFSRAVPDPMGTSYSIEIYRRMGNDTDFTVFRNAGLPGLNFAFMHGANTYHTPQDTLERLDLRSVQHHGDNLLGLTRSLANADLDGNWQGPDAIYFNLGGWFVDYPAPWAIFLSLLLLGATLWRILQGFRHQRLQVRRLLLGIVCQLSGAVLIGFVLHTAASLIVSRYNFLLGPGWSSHSLHFLALALVAGGLAIALGWAMSRWSGAADLVAAGLIVWLAAAVALSFLAPGASYLFAWPLAIALLAWDARDDSAKTTAEEVLPTMRIGSLAAATVVTSLVWAPTLALIGTALGRPAAALIGAMLFLVFAGPLGTQLPLLSAAPKPRWIPSMLIVLGVAFGLTVSFLSSHDARNRRGNMLFYYLDKESDTARWVSFDSAPDEWTIQFLTATPSELPRPSFLGPSGSSLQADAPVGPFAEAQLEMQRDPATPRRFDITVNWRFAIQRAILILKSEGPLQVLSIVDEEIAPLGGEPAGGTGGQSILVVYAPPAGGARFAVEIAAGQTLEIEAIGQGAGLPQLPNFSWDRRPDHLMPRPGWSSDTTYVRSLHRLDPDAAGAPPADNPSGTI